MSRGAATPFETPNTQVSCPVGHFRAPGSACPYRLLPVLYKDRLFLSDDLSVHVYVLIGITKRSCVRPVRSRMALIKPDGRCR
jgi:hypothetical protein